MGNVQVRKDRLPHTGDRKLCSSLLKIADDETPELWRCARDVTVKRNNVPEQLCKHITATLSFLQIEVMMTQVYLLLLLLLLHVSFVLI